jgi:hypothetical protein
MIDGFDSLENSHGGNHGNGKPRTQTGLNGEERASSSYSTTRRRWKNTFQFPGARKEVKRIEKIDEEELG